MDMEQHNTLPESGFLTQFYYTGRHTTGFTTHAQDQNQLRLEKKMRAEAARHAPFTPPAPGSIALGAPSPLGPAWRFYYSHGNIFLDDSYFYNTLHQVEMHAVTGLTAAAPCTLRATLWSYDAVDVWVNGQRAGGIDLPCYKPIQQATLELPLQAGDNQIYLRLETLGVRDTRVAFALKIEDAPAGLRVTLPDAGHAAPCLTAAALLDGAVLAGDTLRLPAPLPEGAQLRLFNSALDVRSTAPTFTLVPAGGQRELPLAGYPQLGFQLEIPAGAATLTRRFARADAPAPAYRPGDTRTALLERIAAVGSIRREEDAGFAMYPMLARRALGRTPASDHEELRATLREIEERMDCADFMVTGLVRYIREYGFPDDLQDELRRVMLGFRYWMDEPGQDGMCFWSENHTLMFFSAAYFFGEIYPDAVFTCSGLTGRELRAKARVRIAEWLGDVNREGFDEFNSTVYTPVTFAAVLNLVDYAEPDLAAAATAACDLMLRRMARHVFKGVVYSPMGRVYDGVIAPWRESLQALVHAADPAAPDVYNEWLSVLATTRYRFPDDLGAIMAECGDFRYPTSNAVVELRKTPDYLLTSVQSPRRDGVARVWQPDEREAVKDHFIYVKSLNEHFHGTTQFQPGEFGYQQHLWTAALDTDLLVFANHPGQTCAAATEVRPGYWYGNGVVPALRQQGRVLGAVYCIPDTFPIQFTHLYWPAAKFDETRAEGRWLLGRRGGSYVAVWCSAALRDHDEVLFGCEKRAETPRCAYLVVCGSAAEDGSFDAFAAACLARDVRFDAAAATPTLTCDEFALPFVPGSNGTQIVG